MFVKNQDALEKLTQEVERLRRGYDDFDTCVKEKIERMRYEILEDKGRLGEGFLLMLRYMFQHTRLRGTTMEQDHPERHTGPHPCVGFYMYLHCFSPCGSLPLSHFQLAPAWVYLEYLFPLCENYYSLGNFILGGIVYLVQIYTYIIRMF